MELATRLHHEGPFRDYVQRVQDYERAGLDLLWVQEAWGFDAISEVGFLSAATDRLQLGTDVVNVFSRTAPAVAQAAAGCDHVSDGRFVLGLGVAGPYEVESFHGVAFEQPVARVVDYIEVCRRAWERRPIAYDGAVVHLPLPANEVTKLVPQRVQLDRVPVRAAIPIFWASLVGRSVSETARLADGWLPTWFDPDRFREVWGDDLREGLARRDPALGPLKICPTVMAAIGDHLAGDGGNRYLDLDRAPIARRVHGREVADEGEAGTILRRYGFGAEVDEIRDVTRDGRDNAEAVAAVPRQLLVSTNLVGPRSYVAERLAAYREAGVTHLRVVLFGPHSAQLRTLETLRDLVG